MDFDNFRLKLEEDCEKCDHLVKVVDVSSQSDPLRDDSGRAIYKNYFFKQEIDNSNLNMCSSFKLPIYSSNSSMESESDFGYNSNTVTALPEDQLSKFFGNGLRNELKKLSCPLCSKKMQSYITYDQHWSRRRNDIEKKHTYKESIFCSLCNEVFPTQQHLRYHLIKVHKEREREKRLKAIVAGRLCLVCNKLFGHKSMLLKHTIEVHNTKHLSINITHFGGCAQYIDSCTCSDALCTFAIVPEDQDDCLEIPSEQQRKDEKNDSNRLFIVNENFVNNNDVYDIVNTPNNGDLPVYTFGALIDNVKIIPLTEKVPIKSNDSSFSVADEFNISPPHLDDTFQIIPLIEKVLDKPNYGSFSETDETIDVDINNSANKTLPVYTFRTLANHVETIPLIEKFPNKPNDSSLSVDHDESIVSSHLHNTSDFQIIPLIEKVSDKANDGGFSDTNEFDVLFSLRNSTFQIIPLVQNVCRNNKFKIIPLIEKVQDHKQSGNQFL